MKIVHVIDGLGRGGAETLLINTIQLLPHDEHIVVCLSHDYAFDPELRKLFTHFVIPLKTKFNIPFIALKVRRLIKKQKPDIVHANLLFPGIITKLACPARVPLFYSIHSEYSTAYFKKSRLIIMLEKFTAKKYHHLIGVSNIVINDYVKYIPNSGTADVLYNFAGEQFFKVNRQLKYTAGSPLQCMAVGNLRAAKNYSYILEQFNLIKQLPVSLDIFGLGAEEGNLKKYKNDNSLINVEFKGSSHNIADAMQHYDVFIACSSTEGFGIAVLEAMAAKLPVVVSSIPVFKEVVADAGFFVDSADRSLSSVLEKIFNGDIDLTQNTEKAHERALTIAARESYGRQLKQLYQKYR